MKIIAAYEFKNARAIRVLLFTARDLRRRKMPECDRIGLEFVNGDGSTVHGLRPDEALIVCALLASGLFKAVRAYDLRLSSGANFDLSTWAGPKAVHDK